MVRRIQSSATPCLDGTTEVQSVPVDDDGGEEIEAGDPVMLALGGAVAELALAVDVQGVLQCVGRLAFVEADLRAV